MSKIRSKNTTPERLVRSFLHKRGYRFRLHQKDLPGTPDIIFQKHKTVIFVNGCFWHQHKGCKRATLPKTNTNYWIPKLNKNIERFKETKKKLKKTNWKFAVIWECETKNLNKVLKRFESTIKK